MAGFYDGLFKGEPGKRKIAVRPVKLKPKRMLAERALPAKKRVTK